MCATVAKKFSKACGTLTISPFLTGSFFESARDNFRTFERAAILQVFPSTCASDFALLPVGAESHDSGIRNKLRCTVTR